MGASVEISSALLHRMMAIARGAGDSTDGAPAPVERCGILYGAGGRIDDLTLTRNVAHDPARSFEIDPAELLAAHRRYRRGEGPAIAGWFHTHPSGSAEPSPRDAEAAEPDGRLWAIATVSEVLLWRAVSAGAIYGRFDPIRIDIGTGLQLERDCAAASWRDV